MKDKVVHIITGEIKGGIYYPKDCVPSIKAIDYLKGLPRSSLPKSLIHRGGLSNSEVYRLLKDGAVIINGKKPQPNEYVEYPVKELVFFPSGKRKTTLVGGSKNDTASS